MQVPKPDQTHIALFRAVVPSAPEVTVKPMFGNLGAFVNGNMFAGLFGLDIGVRLVVPASREQLEAIAGTGPFGPAERPMREYIALPADWAANDHDRLTEWVARAFDEVSELPPKAPKTAR
jgi:TfoX/Sxy family transcriptional regulator of competence genes